MSPSRSLITTFAPCSASSSAVARPIPRADPVTIATLSSSTPMGSSSSVSGGGFCRPGARLATIGPLEPVGAPDHVEHDLVGPGPDAVQPHVAPRALDVRRHVGELVPRHLEAADSAPERLALLRVLGPFVERALRAGDQARRA